MQDLNKDSLKSTESDSGLQVLSYLYTSRRKLQGGQSVGGKRIKQKRKKRLCMRTNKRAEKGQLTTGLTEGDISVDW
jgi:hypothetical protein